MWIPRRMLAIATRNKNSSGDWRKLMLMRCELVRLERCGGSHSCPLVYLLIMFKSIGFGRRRGLSGIR